MQRAWESWMSSYLAGAVLFGVGMCINFGAAGFLIAAGVVTMLGGFGAFLLTKIKTMHTPQASEENNG